MIITIIFNNAPGNTISASGVADVSNTDSATSNGHTLKAEQKSQIYHIGELSRAIHKNELLLHYQPRYESNTGNLVTLEALVRWNHPERGLLLPDAFITLAENTGLISTLGLWVVEQCCNDLSWLSKELKREIRLTINVSPLQCEDTQLAKKILDICDVYEIEPSKFEFEITRIQSNYNDNMLHFCNELANAGAGYNIFDSGTGHASIEDLCDYNVNLIKMRTSFINKIKCTTRKEIVVRRLIELAHELKLRVIAVGVESYEQRDLLTRMNCDILQGFLLSRPLTLENINSNILRI